MYLNFKSQISRVSKFQFLDVNYYKITHLDSIIDIALQNILYSLKIKDLNILLCN